MKQLREEHKIDVVIDLNDKKSEAPKAEKSGLKYIGKKRPMVPTPAALELLSKSIDKEVQAGQRVFVHCHQGIYRAPTVAVAYLIYKGTKTDEAVRQVRKRRPLALPGMENSQRLMPALKLFESKVRAQPKPSK